MRPSILAVVLAAGMSSHGTNEFDHPFTASSDRSFEDLIGESMSRMHVGMADAQRTGDPDHDFVTMMIPHHQGAIDMAKVLLVHGKDPALRQLAKEIIVDQQTEIQMMQHWLTSYASRGRRAIEEQR